MQVLFGGIMRQPCNPTFTQARDSILSADADYYNGINNCVIWKGFAKRGLGVDSSQEGFRDGFKMPSGCHQQ
jgi:extracellular elastinolytic metalloproteinase